MRKSFLSPEINDAEISVLSLPLKIGFKSIDSENYPSRNLYKFDISIEKIVQRQLKSPSSKSDENVYDYAESYKAKLLNKLPFKVSFSREYDEEKEKITIEEVLDNEGNDLPKSVFDLHIQSMSSDNGYWLDYGEFILNIRE